MSLLPVFVQAPRARTEAPAPERRAVEHPGDFADSLASARAEDARATTDDTATVRARQAAQQRAQLQALMLNGAMKFAVTRNDTPCSPSSLPGPVVSMPATPQDDAAAAAALTEGGASVLVPTAGSIETATTPAVSAAPIELDAAASAVPVAPGTEGPKVVSPVPLPPETSEADAEHAMIDPVTMNAATTAAMQLVAVLPMLPQVMALPDAPDVASDCGELPDGSPPRTTGVSMASAPSVSGTTVDAVPDSVVDASALVEDHFDAPASVVRDAASMLAERDAAATTTTSESTTKPTTAGITSATKATAAAAAGAADLTATERDVSRLDPAFRERLERVMERMRKEFGHEVTVVETVRSQARQNALFAQGRTAPGQVVTWTKNSKHGKGLAADLLVDGEWKNPEGYAHLAQVAKQEGLRTLGARDPGHVELPVDGAVSSETLGALLGDLQGDAGDAARQARADVSQQTAEQQRSSTMARVANVAQVARVATVAAVARVAEVARPGEGSRQSPLAGESSSPLAVSGAAPMVGATDLTGSLRVVTPTTSVNMADRITQLMDLQATQAARPLNSVLLRMDNASGIEDQIRIDTRGTAVDARLGLGNAQQAAELTNRLGELREALERRGLTADGVRVQATSGARTVDSASFSRSTAPVIEMAAMRAASDSQAQGNTRDQSARDQQQREAFAREQPRHTPRSSSDDARQRSRREQPEDRR